MPRFVRAILVSLLVLALDLALAGPASAAPILDQEQPTIDTSPGFVFAIGGGSQQKLAQVVTPGRTGNLTEVDLSLACDGDLTIQAQEVSGGKPSGVVLGTLVTTAPVPFPTTFRSFVLPSPIAVTAGAPYAIVLSSTGSCGIWPGPVGDPYLAGDAFFDSRPNPPGIWEPLSLGNGRADLPFRTFVDPSATIADLSAAVRTLHLDRGIENSLMVKLENAQTAADGSKLVSGCARLEAFANEVSAESGKMIAAGDAATLLELAARVKTTLGC
jgi:hypothetical protein